MKKSRLLIIMIIIIFNSSVVFGNESIELNFPSEVSYDKEFDLIVKLNNFTNDDYDIKFEMLNGSRNIAERYWDNEWKSVNFWMENAINNTISNEKSFRIKITEIYNGYNNFTVKIRNSSNYVRELRSNLINIKYELKINNKSENNSNKIYVELEWDEDDIRIGKDFDIEINLFNLEDEKYDIRIWIEDDKKESIISDRYDEDKKEWRSGLYYLDEFFKGPGNASEKLELRIREEYEDYNGDGKIYFKIRDGELFSQDIKILKKKVIDQDRYDAPKKLEVIIPDKEDNTINSRVIKLGGKVGIAEEENIKTNDNYESISEKIKKSIVYFFAFLCVVMSVLIGIRKLE